MPDVVGMLRQLVKKACEQYGSAHIKTKNYEMFLSEVEQALQSQPKLKEAWCVVDCEGNPQGRPNKDKWLIDKHVSEDNRSRKSDKQPYKAVRVWIEQ